MIEIGKFHDLKIVSLKNFGAYLAEEGDEENRILLPIKQVPESAVTGDIIRVFVYRDSADRLIATTKTPLITMEEMAVLKVKENGKIGAFLDWGLEKDLLLPFREQTVKVEEGHSYLVRLYTDKSNRLCASMKLYHHLLTDSPYKKDDVVSATVYDTSKDFGIFAAIDDKYSALIPRQEMKRNIPVGTKIEARVSEVKPDGRINLSIHEKSYLQMNEDAEMLYELLDEYDGVFPFPEDAPADIIATKTGLSKNAFKRAAGRLYKEGRITINNKIIRRV